MFSSRAARLSLFAVLAMACVVSSASVTSSADASSSCFRVKGHYAEQFAGGPQCTSPVGLCIAGRYRGAIRGDFFGTATSITPTADTPVTNVQLFTSDSVIHARVRGYQGDLIIKNAGAFQSVDAGNIVDVQTITGGTGQLSGASGVIRASGTFDFVAGAGTSAYEGMICLP